jgi:hypothetical protein
LSRVNRKTDSGDHKLEFQVEFRLQHRNFSLAASNSVVGQ